MASCCLLLLGLEIPSDQSEFEWGDDEDQCQGDSGEGVGKLSGAWILSDGGVR